MKKMYSNAQSIQRNADWVYHSKRVLQAFELSPSRDKANKPHIEPVEDQYGIISYKVKPNLDTHFSEEEIDVIQGYCDEINETYCTWVQASLSLIDTLPKFTNIFQVDTKMVKAAVEEMELCDEEGTSIEDKAVFSFQAMLQSHIKTSHEAIRAELNEITDKLSKSSA